VRWKNASSSIVEPGLRVWSIGFFRRARAWCLRQTFCGHLKVHTLYPSCFVY
jgi:hypothetical protein